MSAPNDGGPAFPPSRDPYSYPSGMTLRDYFAAKAMAALITEPPFPEGSRAAVAVWDDRDDGDHGPDQYAYVAYRMADAMLRAREVKA